MCGAGAGECPRLQPAAPLGVPVFLIEISADANQVLVSQPVAMRHRGLDGWGRTVCPPGLAGVCFIAIFVPKAHWLADFCPLASSSMAPSVGPREPSGAGLGMFSGGGGRSLMS